VPRERGYHHRNWTSRRPPSRPTRRQVRSPRSHRSWTKFSGPVTRYAADSDTAGLTRRLASSHTSRRGPPRRMRHPQLNQRDLDHHRHLMRTRTRHMRPIRQTLQPTRLITGQPPMHRLARHPEPGRHTRHRLAVGDHRPDGLIPLLSHRHLPHEPGVSPISRSSCHPSTETLLPLNRSPVGRHQPKSYNRTGAPPGTRTPNPRIKSPLLCQLS
jgi:hypothetical protein